MSHLRQALGHSADPVADLIHSSTAEKIQRDGNNSNREMSKFRTIGVGIDPRFVWPSTAPTPWDHTSHFPIIPVQGDHRAAGVALQEKFFKLSSDL